MAALEAVRVRAVDIPHFNWHDAGLEHYDKLPYRKRDFEAEVQNPDRQRISARR